MTRLLPLSLLMLVCTTGCSRHPQPNSSCEWPQETAAQALNPSPPSQQRRLSDDAEFAEDLAIRYADAHWGPRSGHFEGMAEYGRTRDQCMAALFKVIGTSHGVPEEQIRRSLGHRRIDLDLAVILCFAVLYGCVANVIARRLHNLYAYNDGSLTEVVMTIFASAAVSAAGVLVGEQWSLIIETYRLSSGHLSYRVARIPWNQHRLGLFVGGVVLFWVLAVLHRRHASKPSIQIRNFEI
jgi:hypothetical protein